jgi:hypothetical protein
VKVFLAIEEGRRRKATFGRADRERKVTRRSPKMLAASVQA